MIFEFSCPQSFFPFLQREALLRYGFEDKLFAGVRRDEFTGLIIAIELDAKRAGQIALLPAGNNGFEIVETFLGNIKVIHSPALVAAICVVPQPISISIGILRRPAHRRAPPTFASGS